MNTIYTGNITPAIETQQLVSIRDIIYLLKRHLIFIAVSTVLMIAVAIFYSYSLTPIYQATASLEIEQQEQKILSIEDIYSVSGTDVYLKTQHEIMKSRGVMEKVVNQLELTALPEFNPSLRKPSELSQWLNWRKWLGFEAEPASPPTAKEEKPTAIGILTGKIAVASVPNTQVVYIHAQSETPALAAKIADAVANAYIETWLESKYSLTNSATNWMQERLGDLADGLEQTEQTLQTYREQENLINLDSELELNTSELTALTQSLAATRGQLAEAESVYREIKANSDSSFSTLPAVLANPLIQNLKQDEAAAERKVEELARRYGPKHPKMIAANTELSSIQDSIKYQTTQIAQSIIKKYQVALANEKALAATVEQARERVQEISRKQYRLSELERQVKTRRDLYDAFFTRIGETRATADLQNANARIIDRAYIPKGPIKPRKKLIVIAAALAGLLLSVGGVLLLEMLNNTIRSSRDVEEKLNLPVLGMLPKLNKKDKPETVRKLFLEDNDSPFAEAIRSIRTSINLTALEHPHKIFAFISSNSDEGKSSIALNVALALGRLGKTILIDADLRRPSVAVSMGIENSDKGLSNFLAGQITITEALVKTDDIDVIPAGSMPPNPQELLSSDAFSRLVESLREKYVSVVIDCPPVHGLSDSMVTAKVSDSAIYVVEAGRISVPVIRSGISKVIRTGTPIAGVVLNKVDFSSQNPYEIEAYSYQGS